MVLQPVTLRAARPTTNDGLEYALYLNEAAEGFFRFMLGSRAASIIATAFALPDHDLSYQHATFAVREETIVGMVAGYTVEQHRRSSLQPLIQAAGKRNLRMRIVRCVFAPLLQVIDSIEDGDFYLQAVAVERGARGTGLGSILVDSFERRARDKGAARLALDVSARNAGAIRFYEARGMTIEEKWPQRLKVPGLTLYRMVKTLD